MNRFRTITAAAALAGFSLIAGFGAALSATSASGVGVDQTTSLTAAQRIGAAFALVAQAEAGLSGAAKRGGKGDLLVGLGCSSQRWPDIAADCLVSADGRSKRPVRTVTIGYQDGEARTVLIRRPAPQIAAR